jgi:pyruvate dehydrogenase E2 component (dihydrolipoamide acetyltransferase)
MEVNIPRLGVGMTEGTLVSWLVEHGGTVEPGQPLYVLETDKVEGEVAAPAGGVVVHLVPAGETYPVGTPIAAIEGGLHD